MLAICGNDALRELSSPGKSGSLFYLTQDDRFMIKTVKKSEVKVCCQSPWTSKFHISFETKQNTTRNWKTFSKVYTLVAELTTICCFHRLVFSSHILSFEIH